jgi:hypothetical protein
MKRVLALTTLLFALGLLASRTGLVLHEVGGHWGVAAAFGCKQNEIHLFYFGGGWVDFDCAPLTPAQALAIDLAGIALQFAVAAPLLLLARRRASPGVELACSVVGWLFVVHGLWYLVTGMHYGVGDGRTSHRIFAAQRGVLVTMGSVVLVACCGGGAFALGRRLSSRVVARRWSLRVAMLAGAMLVAAAVHGALTWTEMKLREDPVYAATFKPEHEQKIEVEMRKFEAANEPTPEQVVVQRKALASRYRVFPLKGVLGVAMGVATIAGVAISLRPTGAG